MQIKQLQTLIESQLQQADFLDKHYGSRANEMFEEHLFQANRYLLIPCINECKSTLNKLITKLDTKNSIEIKFLCEKLLAQQEAIQKELLSQEIRNNEYKNLPKPYTTIDKLAGDYAKHQEWERRLLLMVQNKRKQVEFVPSPSSQKELVALENRLERCRAAMLKLEKKIMYIETKKYQH